jgi:peptidyl-prolyl cis-trans isomerase A (cyclophilin A)
MKASLASLLSIALLAAPFLAHAADVRVLTALGEIDVALDRAHAPLTTCNFVRYAKARAYDGGAFFRVVSSAHPDKNPSPIDVVQAETPRGSDDHALGAVRLEGTRQTGLRHLAGAISMARDAPDSAGSSFFIVTKDSPNLDEGGPRNPDRRGFAAFGHVTRGLEIVRRIEAMPAKDDILTRPVTIEKVTVSDAVVRACG